MGGRPTGSGFSRSAYFVISNVIATIRASRYAPANRRNMYQSDYTVQMLAIARMLLEHGADANLDGRDGGDAST